jgi:two-component system OmpR family response regulator
LVEGDPHRLDSLGFALRRRGYHVLSALDGNRAAELLARNLPDVVVVEMLLPGQSGFQVALLVKAWSEGQVPVVMLAGLAADAHREYALALGVDTFLAPPPAPRDVVDAVEGLCPLPANGKPTGSGTIGRPTPSPA